MLRFLAIRLRKERPQPAPRIDSAEELASSWRMRRTVSDFEGAIDGQALWRHLVDVSSTKKRVAPKQKKTPGTIMAEEIRASANKLTDAERESLLGDAMRIIYGSEGKAAHAGRR